MTVKRSQDPQFNLSLLLRSLLIWPQSGCSHKPCRWIGRGSESFDRSPPTQIIREVYGGDAMEPPHPFLETAVVGVHVVDVQIRCVRQWTAWRGQNMERHPGTARECLDGRAAVTAQFRGPADDLLQDCRDAGGIETRQNGIDGCAGAVTRHQDRDLLRRQAPLAGFATAPTGRPRQPTALALEGLQNKRLVGLDDPG